ncbi:hypothetical protein PR048_029755 [Dryococelus australis]|uniref:Uncharacterized protein n=1 Tax=Dryococelus australis TaxID=614101 RepID=A0ABQ9GEA2_9NEOP|nr:hypothetical protein PR048_029755 [Dryococelus australis]
MCEARKNDECKVLAMVRQPLIHRCPGRCLRQSWQLRALGCCGQQLPQPAPWEIQRTWPYVTLVLLECSRFLSHWYFVAPPSSLNVTVILPQSVSSLLQRAGYSPSSLRLYRAFTPGECREDSFILPQSVSSLLQRAGYSPSSLRLYRAFTPGECREDSFILPQSVSSLLQRAGYSPSSLRLYRAFTPDFGGGVLRDEEGEARSRGGSVARALPPPPNTQHHDDPGSTPSRVAPGFPHMGIVPDDAASRVHVDTVYTRSARSADSELRYDPPSIGRPLCLLSPLTAATSICHSTARPPSLLHQSLLLCQLRSDIATRCLLEDAQVYSAASMHTRLALHY